MINASMPLRGGLYILWTIIPINRMDIDTLGTAATEFWALSTLKGGQQVAAKCLPPRPPNRPLGGSGSPTCATFA
eukprot:594915-Prorocentrum_minimum.AAC.1